MFLSKHCTIKANSIYLIIYEKVHADINEILKGRKIMNQASLDGQYYIHQVADVTGLSKQVIRKWEERYDLVHPERLANGYRIYSEKDVNTLMKVKELSEKGYSIKQAVVFVNKLSHSEQPIVRKQERNLPFSGLNDYVLQLLEKGVNCEEFEINYLLQKAYNHHGLSKFLKDVVIPFLKEVGNKWEKGEWSEYQESVSSIVVRDFLVQIRRNFFTREDASLVIGACLPYEQHEIPLHILLLQFMMRGWKTILVGTSPAPGSIESLVRKLKPSIVLLSASTTIPFEEDPYLLTQLDQFAAENKKIKFYLGGSGALEFTKTHHLHTIVVNNIIEDILDEKASND